MGFFADLIIPSTRFHPVVRRVLTRSMSRVRTFAPWRAMHGIAPTIMCGTVKRELSKGSMFYPRGYGEILMKLFDSKWFAASLATVLISLCGFFSVASAADTQKASSERRSFQTSDGVTIVYDVYRPGQAQLGTVVLL